MSLVVVLYHIARTMNFNTNANLSLLPPYLWKSANPRHTLVNHEIIQRIPSYASLPGNNSLTEKTRIKDLNIQDVYAKDKELSVKEHLQNWRDQCVVVGKSINP